MSSGVKRHPTGHKKSLKFGSYVVKSSQVSIFSGWVLRKGFLKRDRMCSKESGEKKKEGRVGCLLLLSGTT